jgi:hypothetical protein
VTLTLTAKGFAALKFIVQSHSASALAAGLFSLASARRICKTAYPLC